MKLNVLFVPLFLLVLCTNAFAHDIHISYSQAEVKPGGLYLKVSYYKDDFTKAVKNWYQGKADNYSAEQFKNAEFEYIKNFYRLWTDRDLKHQIIPTLLGISDNG